MSLVDRLGEYRKFRARSAPLPTGSSSYTCSDFFKLQNPRGKPKALSWDHRTSLDSVNRKISPLKASSYNHQRAMVSLGTARPASEYYPWESISMRCISNIPSQSNENQNNTSKFCSVSCSKGETEYDLGVALNYGHPIGSPQALRFITEHVEFIHNPPYADWESCLTCGSTSALEIALRLFCDRGDTVIVEDFTYPGTLSAIQAQGLQPLGVDVDGCGLVPEVLDRKLQNWTSCQGPKPFVLYMIPTGQNPTGLTQSVARRREIYQVAEKHDLYILEDDPYYYLQMEGLHIDCMPSQEIKTFNTDAYLSQLPPSYLSLDISGRVLRLDSTSKILAPGLRCGWVTGCSQIIEKFASYSETGPVSPSGPSQVMLYKLLDQTWGHQGFLEWLVSLSQKYRQRRDTLIKACLQHLPYDICRWEVPDAGMFIWIYVDASKHPRFVKTDIPSEISANLLIIEDRIFSHSQENGVLVSKGSWFTADRTSISTLFFRLTFVASPEESLMKGVEVVAQAVRSVFAK